MIMVTMLAIMSSFVVLYLVAWLVILTIYGYGFTAFVVRSPGCHLLLLAHGIKDGYVL